VPALLVVGDAFRTPEMRHEVPIGDPDPIALIETDAVGHAVVPALDGLVVHVDEDLVLVTDDGFESTTDFPHEMEL